MNLDSSLLMEVDPGFSGVSNTSMTSASREVNMMHFGGSVFSRRGVVDMLGKWTICPSPVGSGAASPMSEASTQVDLDEFVSEEDDDIEADLDSFLIDFGTAGPGVLYIVDKVIYRGMSTEVYSAHDVRQNRSIAIKIYRAGKEEAFWLECNLIRRIMMKTIAVPCPYLAKYHGFTCRRISDIPESRQLHGIKMQRYPSNIWKFVVGHSSEPRRQLQILEKFALHILEAIAYINKHFDLIHFDLKPGNVMIDQTDPGNPKAVLIDFGSARHSVHKTYSTCSTITYTSPEDLFGLSVDKSHDVWSLGVMLAEIAQFSTEPLAESARGRREQLIQLLGDMPYELHAKMHDAGRAVYARAWSVVDSKRDYKVIVPEDCPPKLAKIIQAALVYSGRPTATQLLTDLSTI